MRFDTTKRQLHFDNPHLPESITTLEIKTLKMPSAVVDVTLERHSHDVAVNVGRRSGEVEVVVIH
jgi:hypothetical protein